MRHLGKIYRVNTVLLKSKEYFIKMPSMKKNALNILLIEDDLLSRLSLKTRLESFGSVTEADSKTKACELIKNQNFDIAYIDLDLEEELLGLDVLKVLTEKNIYSVVLSGREDESIVEKAYQIGCKDYLIKPYSKSGIELIFKRYYSRVNQNQNLKKLKDLLLTNDLGLINELRIIEQALLSTSPIFIAGESGTGKTYLAKFIHKLISEKKEIPFIHLNCAEISESLLESELFGHEKGAFTGAIKNKKGLLELANEGILFLDEIATMPLSIQKKLLKAIEEKSFYPLGSEEIVRSNFRLISATCEDLQTKIELGLFREDFYFRIEGFNVKLKSLRDRRNDLNTLLKYFIKKGDRAIVFDSAAKSFMNEYQWPGNIRELERTIEILKTKENGIVTLQDLKQIISYKNKHQEENLNEIDEALSFGLKKYLEKIETRIVKKVHANNQSKVRKTLSDLKISNNAFYRIMSDITP